MLMLKLFSKYKAMPALHAKFQEPVFSKACAPLVHASAHLHRK